MENRYTYLIKNASLLTISNFSSKILAFFLVPIYTHILSTRDVGLYDLVMTTLQLLIPVLSLNISEGVMRFMMEEKSDKTLIATTGLKLTIISSVVFGGLLSLNYCLNIFPSIRAFSIWMGLYFSFRAYNMFVTQFAKGRELVGPMAISGIISTAILLLSVIVFLVIWPFGLLGLIISDIISQMISGLYLTIKTDLFKYIKFTKPIKEPSELIIYSVPLIMNSLGWWANSSADKYIITAMCGIGINGLFSVAYKIPTIINTVQSIFTQAWQISAVKESGKDDSKGFYNSVFCSLNVIVSLCCATLIILTKFISSFLYGASFFEAWQYVPFLLVSSVINTGSGILGPILLANKDSKVIASSAVRGVVVNLIMNVLLIHIIGPQGAAIATVISSFIIFISRHFALNKYNIVIPLFTVVITWVLLALQSVIMIYFGNYYIQIIIIALLVFINRKDISLIVVRMKKVFVNLRKL